MQRVLVGKSLIRCTSGLRRNPFKSLSACSLSEWPGAPRSYHATGLLLSKRRRSSSAKQKVKGRSKRRRQLKSQEREDSIQEWLTDGKPKSSALQVPVETKPLTGAPTSNGLPVEIWSEAQSDATFFHGREGLALQWTSTSVPTSQHPAVKAMLQHIQSRDQSWEEDDMEEDEVE